MTKIGCGKKIGEFKYKILGDVICGEPSSTSDLDTLEVEPYLCEECIKNGTNN